MRCGRRYLKGMAVLRVLVIPRRGLHSRTLMVMAQHRGLAILSKPLPLKTLRGSIPPPLLKVRKSYSLITMYICREAEEQAIPDPLKLQNSNNHHHNINILPTLPRTPSPHHLPRFRGPVPHPHRSTWLGRKSQPRAARLLLIRLVTKVSVSHLLGNRRLILFSELCPCSHCISYLL